MKLSDVAKAVNATLFGNDIELPPIAIDSRKIQGKEIFVALKGENFDGHDYIGEAIRKGAIAIMAQREPLLEEKTISFLQVKDTTVALGEMASWWRGLFSIPVVGLTGSCGKTTVKGLIDSLCQQKGKTLATKGNLNNHIGLPLSLMDLNSTHQYAVIEMGANHPGEIGYLAKIAKPTIALITNVNPAHLEGFGSLENVAKAKGEIYESLPQDGIAILNMEDAFSDYWRQVIGRRKTITFGFKPDADVRATNIQLHPFHIIFTLNFKNHQSQVKINIPGNHMVMNALAAAAVGVTLDFSIEKIVAGLEAFGGVSGRLKRFKGINNAVVIDDTYNANPGSMRAALDVLAGCQGERIFVMGDMGELGENTVDYHAQIGDYARQKGIDCLFAVGKLTEHSVKAFGKKAKMYPTKEALVDDLKSLLNSQTILLVKGSRSAKMEMVTQALTVKE